MMTHQELMDLIAAAKASLTRAQQALDQRKKPDAEQTPDLAAWFDDIIKNSYGTGGNS